MPQIVSLLPTAPAMPAATPAAGASAASAVAPGTPLPTDPTSPNFLAQLKAALKTVAKVVVQPPLIQRPATDPNAAPLMSPVSEVPLPADAEKHVDVSMPDLLAQLGFAVVPAVFPVPSTPQSPVLTGGAGNAQAKASQSLAPLAIAPAAKLGPVGLQGSVVPVLAEVGQALPTPQLGQTLPSPQLGQPLSAPQVAQTLPPPQLPQTLPASLVAQTVSTPQLGQALADLQLGQLLPQAVPTSTPVSHQPIAQLKPSDQPQPLTAQPAPSTPPDLAATVMLPPTPGAAPAAPAVTTSAPLIGLVQAASQNGASQSNTAGSERGRHPSDKVAAPTSEVTPVQYAPTPEAAMAAAAATTINPAPLPVQVGPSQVVSQIAQHADVIRLPGNQGLHIQLHPYDLGGVQVTVRYSAAGGVELHINAEHASTAALVQAGWTELRDSLASRGISADRLMMSVTAPPSIGQADLSGGDRNRSDPNAYGAGQSSLSSPDSQSQGQSRQDNAPQRTSQTWSNGLEPVASTDDNPRVASATGTPSRIDYRV